MAGQLHRGSHLDDPRIPQERSQRGPERRADLRRQRVHEPVPAVGRRELHEAGEPPVGPERVVLEVHLGVGAKTKAETETK